MIIAKDMGANVIKIYIDSHLVASQILCEYQVREEHLREYVQLVQVKMKKIQIRRSSICSMRT